MRVTLSRPFASRASTLHGVGDLSSRRGKGGQGTEVTFSEVNGVFSMRLIYPDGSIRIESKHLFDGYTEKRLMIASKKALELIQLPKKGLNDVA